METKREEEEFLERKKIRLGKEETRDAKSPIGLFGRQVGRWRS